MDFFQILLQLLKHGKIQVSTQLLSLKTNSISKNPHFNKYEEK